MQVLHVSGRGKQVELPDPVPGPPGQDVPYVVVAYVDRMDLAYAAADAVVCRAGAGTVCELSALGVPAAYVPLPVGNGEQRRNAEPVVAAGGGLLVADADLDPAWLRSTLLPVLADPARLAAMAAAARAHGVLDAADRLGDLVVRAATGGPPDAHRPPDPATSPARPPSTSPTDPVRRPDPSAEALLGLLRTGPVHVVAAGGAGMSAVVRLLLDDGVPVTGSDSRASATLDALAARGAQVHVGHDAAHVAGAVLVVVSTAVRPDNPEVAAAREAGVPVVHRSVALAGLMHGSRVVAVAGTHGKTTTTSMTAVAARAAGLDPSYAIGGDLVLDRVNARRGADPVFVAEADESDGSFLAYRPDVAVVTNVEADHLDHYGDVEAVHAAFARFAARVRPGGLLVVGADDRGARALVRGLGTDGPRVLTVGEAADADLRVVLEDPAAVSEEGSGVLAAARLLPSAGTGPTGGPAEGWALRLRVPGRHNVADAALAFAAAVLGLGLDPDRVAEGSPGSPARAAASSSWARPAGSGSSTTTPTTPPRWPRPWPRPAPWPARQGARPLPAAPVLADPDLRRRLRHGPRRRRDRGRARRLRRPRGPRAGRHRGHRRRPGPGRAVRAGPGRGRRPARPDRASRRPRPHRRGGRRHRARAPAAGGPRPAPRATRATLVDRS